MDKELEKIFDVEVAKPRPPGFGVTVIELAKSKNIPIETARSILGRLCENGILEKTRMRDGKKNVFVYSKVIVHK